MEKKKHEGNSKYITTHGELEEFAKQVEERRFPDEKLKKAYEKFKRPVWQQAVAEQELQKMKEKGHDKDSK